MLISITQGRPPPISGWVWEKTRLTLPKSHKLLATNNIGQPRIFLLAREEHLNVFLLPNFRNEENVAARLEGGAR